MKNNPYIWLTVTVALFVAFSVMLAVFMPEDDFPVTDPDADTTGPAFPEETTGEGKPTDTETETEIESESESSDTESSRVDINDIPAGKENKLEITGGYVPDSALVDELTDAIEAFGRPISLFAVDLKTGVAISYNADARLKAASVIKAPFVYYVCRQIDLGKASFDEKLTYTAADTVYGNGTIGKAGIGAEFTLYDVIRHTVVTSDNEGYYMLLRRFGCDGYDAMMKELGCDSLCVSGSRWPKISAVDMAKIWQKIYEYRNETDTGAKLYDLFGSVEYMTFIEDALGVQAHNKAGWNASSFNESGIVDGKKSVYAIAIMTEGSYYNAPKSQFYDIIRFADRLMNEQ